VGLYSLSSFVGWKAGNLAASDASLAFPFKVGSASIFRLRREFSYRSASISSALRFFRSANSCCILAWPSRMTARSGVMLAAPEGPTLVCLLTSALLRVETILREKRILRCSSHAPRWAPIVLAENKQDKLGKSVTLPT